MAWKSRYGMRKFSKRRKYIRKRTTARGYGRIKKFAKSYAKRTTRIPKRMYAAPQAYAWISGTYNAIMKNGTDSYGGGVNIKGNSLKNPMGGGFDRLSSPCWQLMQQYTRYKVLKSKIRVNYIWESAGAAISNNKRLLLLQPNGDEELIYTSLDIGFNSDSKANPMQLPYGRYKIDLVNEWVNNKGYKTLKNEMSTNKLFKKKVKHEDDFEGTCDATGSNDLPTAVITDPAKVWRWKLFMMDTAEPATIAAGTLLLHVLITVKYFVRFYQRDPRRRSMNQADAAFGAGEDLTELPDLG